MFRHDTYPRLRPVQIERIDHHGPAFLLRDPLQLSAGSVVAPEAYGPLLAALDGQTSYGELSSELAKQLGEVSGPALLAQLLQALDQAFLLDNEAFQAAHAAAVAAYRSAPHRPLGFITQAQPAILRAELDGYLRAAEAHSTSAGDTSYRGILSPHIDYARGGAVYGQIWQHAAEAARRAQFVIMLATDHYSAEPITLTHQRYATPYGVLETDHELVATLAEAVGPRAFNSELYHRHEHSVELVANWLHHMRAGASYTLIPILCGSFQRYTQQASDPFSSDPSGDPLNDASLRGLVEVLQDVLAKRDALVVISGDLAHVGPAFGDPALDDLGERQLLATDTQILNELRAGRPDQLLANIRAIGDRNKICGLPPSYLALCALGKTHATQHGYLRCPADPANTSAVTIAGLAFA